MDCRSPLIALGLAFGFVFFSSSPIELSRGGFGSPLRSHDSLAEDDGCDDDGCGNDLGFVASVEDDGCDDDGCGNDLGFVASVEDDGCDDDGCSNDLGFSS